VKREPYFFSSGLDSLGEDGIGVDGAVDELAAPPAELEAAAPVLPGVVVVSALGAGVGAGVGEAVGALGAGGGVVTVFSSFLQAVRLTATRAAMRSERVIMFSFVGDISFNGVNNALD
jgi:hypothetical protein